MYFLLDLKLKTVEHLLVRCVMEKAKTTVKLDILKKWQISLTKKIKDCRKKQFENACESIKRFKDDDDDDLRHAKESINYLCGQKKSMYDELFDQ